MHLLFRATQSLRSLIVLAGGLLFLQSGLEDAPYKSTEAGDAIRKARATLAAERIQYERVTSQIREALKSDLEQVLKEAQNAEPAADLDLAQRARDDLRDLNAIGRWPASTQTRVMKQQKDKWTRAREKLRGRFQELLNAYAKADLDAVEGQKLLRDRNRFAAISDLAASSPIDPLEPGSESGWTLTNSAWTSSALGEGNASPLVLRTKDVLQGEYSVVVLLERLAGTDGIWVKVCDGAGECTIFEVADGVVSKPSVSPDLGLDLVDSFGRGQTRLRLGNYCGAATVEGTFTSSVRASSGSDSPPRSSISIQCVPGTQFRVQEVRVQFVSCASGETTDQEKKTDVADAGAPAKPGTRSPAVPAKQKVQPQSSSTTAVAIAIHPDFKATLKVTATDATKKQVIHTVDLSGKDKVPHGSGANNTQNADHWRAVIKAELQKLGVAVRKPSQSVVVTPAYGQADWTFDLLP